MREIEMVVLRRVTPPPDETTTHNLPSQVKSQNAKPTAEQIPETITANNTKTKAYPTNLMQHIGLSICEHFAGTERFNQVQTYLQQNVMRSKQQLLQYVIPASDKKQSDDPFWQFIQLTVCKPPFMQLATHKAMRQFWQSFLDGKHAIGDYHIKERYQTNEPYLLVARAYINADIKTKVAQAKQVESLLNVLKEDGPRACVGTLQQQVYVYRHPLFKDCIHLLNKITANTNQEQTSILIKQVESELTKLAKTYWHEANNSIDTGKRLGDIYPHEVSMREHLVTLMQTELDETSLENALETAEKNYHEMDEIIAEWGPNTSCNLAFYAFMVALTAHRTLKHKAVPPLDIPPAIAHGSLQDQTAWYERQEAGWHIYRWLHLALKNALFTQTLITKSNRFAKTCFNAQQNRHKIHFSVAEENCQEKMLMQGECVASDMQSIQQLIQEIQQSRWISNHTLQTMQLEAENAIESPRA